MSKLLMTLAVPIALISGYYLIENSKDFSKAEDNLMLNRDYQKVQFWDNIENGIIGAKDHLKYHAAWTQNVTTTVGKVTTSIPIHHPASYPDCKDASNLLYSISSAVDEQIAKTNDGSCTLSKDLKEISDVLPDVNDYKKYNGESVNNKTFKSERDDLQALANQAKMKSDYCLERVPEHLLGAKSKASLGIFGSILGLIGGIIMGAVGYNRNKQQNYND